MKLFIVCSLLICVMALPAAAELELNQEDISWTTDAGIVTFQMTFRNVGPEPSLLSSGELHAQPFGAFVGSTGLIGTFDIPPIPPESFFDVFYEIPLSELPPSAAEILPWGMGAKDEYCPQDWHWDDNVDVIWNGPGGSGSTQAHNGTLQVCPGFGGSLIHIVTNCVGPVGWTITGLCAGFTATLVNEDQSPAGNPLLPGWTGYIAVTAPLGTPVGTVCCFSVNFTCLGVTVPVNLCVTTCDCGPIGIDAQSWGTIKGMYR